MTGPQAVNREDDLAFAKNFIRDIPPVTRVLFFGTLLCTSLQQFGLLPVGLFVLDWRSIVYKFAIWTPFFSMFHAGAPGFHFLMSLYFLYTYSRQVESNSFFGRTAAYAWMLAICMMVIIPLAFVFGFYLAGPALLMAIMHMWGRNAGDTRVTLYGIVPIPAKYLSLAVLGLNTVLSGSPSMADVAGILAGQLYYFLDSVFPHLEQGCVVIAVPGWFERLVGVIEDSGGRALGLNSIAGGGTQQTTGTARTTGTYTTVGRGSAATGDRRQGPQPRARHQWGSGRTLGSS